MFRDNTCLPNKRIETYSVVWKKFRSFEPKSMRNRLETRNVDNMYFHPSHCNYLPTLFSLFEGKLMLVASKTDFDLSKSLPKGGFQLLKYPESFRACLVQV